MPIPLLRFLILLRTNIILLLLLLFIITRHHTTAAPPSLLILMWWRDSCHAPYSIAGRGSKRSEGVSSIRSKAATLLAFWSVVYTEFCSCYQVWAKGSMVHAERRRRHAVAALLSHSRPMVEAADNSRSRKERRQVLILMVVAIKSKCSHQCYNRSSQTGSRCWLPHALLGRKGMNKTHLPVKCKPRRDILQQPKGATTER